MPITRYSCAVKTDDNGQQYFTHFICGRKSYNPNDIKFKYCAVCHTFPEDEEKRATIKLAKKEAVKNPIQKGY